MSEVTVGGTTSVVTVEVDTATASSIAAAERSEAAAVRAEAVGDMVDSQMTAIQADDTSSFAQAQAEKIGEEVANQGPAIIAGSPLVAAGAAAAAAAAVTGEVASRNLVQGNDTRLPVVRAIPGVSIALTAGINYTFLTANDTDGAPTPLAAGLIGKSLGLVTKKIDGVSVAITAKDDVYTFLTANDVDGGPTPLSAGLIATAVKPLLGITDQVPAIVYLPEVSGGDLYTTDLASGVRRKVTTGVPVTGAPQVVGDAVVFTSAAGQQWVPVTGGQAPGPIFPSTSLVVRGDSHAAGSAGAGTNIATVAASALSVPAYNDGRGGWGSADVALNTGAIDVQITVAGNQIPTSGPVEITAKNPPLGWRTFGGTTVINIAGVLKLPTGDLPGTFRFDAPTLKHYFVRAASGSVIACPPATTFKANGDAYRDRTQIIVVGANTIPYGDDRLPAFLDQVEALVRYQSSLAKRSLILSIITGAQNYNTSTWYRRVVAANKRLAEIYGDTFIDDRRYLIDHGLADAGITPTAADQYSIDRDTIPPSLLADDLTHLLAPGLTIRANLAVARMRQLGWYPTP